MKVLAPEMAVKAFFFCYTKDLRAVFKMIKGSVKKTWMEERPYCEITIKNNEIQFVAGGIRHTLTCEAKGPARVVISFAYLLHLVNDRSRVKTKVWVGDNVMTVNEVTVFVDTWFFTDDTILRSIDLPANYGISHLIRLTACYTEKEIEFNKLGDEYQEALLTFENDIRFISGILVKYGIKGDDVKKFVHDKVWK